MRAEAEASRGAGHQRAAWRTWPVWIGAIALVAALAACSVGEQGDPAVAIGTVVSAAGTPTGSPPRTPTGTGSPISASPAAGPPGTTGFRVAAADGGGVVWATSVDPTTRAPIERVTTFRPDASVLYAALPLARVEPGTVLTATWSYNRTPLQGLAGTVTAPAGATARETWVAFDLARAPDQPWPTGTYAVQVAIDGTPVVSGEIEVQIPT